MKHMIVMIFGLGLGLVLGTPTAQAATHISSFQSDIAILADGAVEITETITMVFEEDRHGLYRDLPYRYTGAGTERYTEVVLLEATRNGATEQFNEERNGNNLRFKIGNPAVTVRGSQEYRLHYRISGILEGFPTYDELYWNVTGTDWQMPIRNATVRVTLPEDGLGSLTCYAGAAGADTPCFGLAADGRHAEFVSGRPLNAGEGMTIAVAYAKDMVPLLRPVDPAAAFIANLFSLKGIALFLLTLGLSVAFAVSRYRRFGRDIDSRRLAIVPIYEPPNNLRPAEIGLILDERADTIDISATIVDLAVRGYLTIEELPKKFWQSRDYRFTRTKKTLDQLKKYEVKLLEALLPESGGNRTLSSLHTQFAQDLGKVQRTLYEEAVHQDLFTVSPTKNRTLYLIIGLVAVGVSIAGIMSGVAVLLWPLTVVSAGLLIGGIVLVCTSPFLAQRSAAGSQIYREALGYKLFVSNTEKYRQPFFEKEGIFMDILPYAIVFGVAKKLAKDFQSMGIEPAAPAWFVGANTFNAASFAANMTSLSTQLTAAMASTPGSSGVSGGSVGGGFGGGGGGAW